METEALLLKIESIKMPIRILIFLGTLILLGGVFIWLVYLFPFLYAMARANIDVAYRVLTGRINPGIVKISPNLKNDMALTILANSITLTPGTLSVDVDEESNDLYVHWINVQPDALKEMPRDYHPICNSFPDWARRIAG